MTFWIILDVRRERYQARLMREAIERADFDRWENDD